jgi:hypothetical protein
MRRLTRYAAVAAVVTAAVLPSAPAQAVDCGDLALVCGVVCTIGQKIHVECGY